MNQCDGGLTVSDLTSQKLRSSIKLRDKLLNLWYILNSVNFSKFLSLEQLESYLAVWEKAQCTMAQPKNRSAQRTKSTQEMPHVQR